MAMMNSKILTLFLGVAYLSGLIAMANHHISHLEFFALWVTLMVSLTTNVRMLKKMEAQNAEEE